MPRDHTPRMRAPSRGTVVTYAAGLRDDGQDRFRLALVVGPIAVDPATGGTWIGVQVPGTGNTVDLIDSRVIVNVSPPR
jgi:hypothetical protein